MKLSAKDFLAEIGADVKVVRNKDGRGKTAGIGEPYDKQVARRDIILGTWVMVKILILAGH
jgi:hypothetical protein